MTKFAIFIDAWLVSILFKDKNKFQIKLFAIYLGRVAASFDIWIKFAGMGGVVEHVSDSDLPAVEHLVGATLSARAPATFHLALSVLSQGCCANAGDKLVL